MKQKELDLVLNGSWSQNDESMPINTILTIGSLLMYIFAPLRDLSHV